MENYQLQANLTEIIEAKIEEISTALMEKECKCFAMVRISPQDWVTFRDKGNGSTYILAPSIPFKRLILDRGYLKAIGNTPKLFGTGNPADVLHALMKIDSIYNQRGEDVFDEYVEYLRSENMAYVFKLENEGISDRILRLDLFRGYKDNDFLGGFFHVLKHFNLEDYCTISQAKKGEFNMCWNNIYYTVIRNFFSDDFRFQGTNDTGELYEARSKFAVIEDEHTMLGCYYKRNDVPIYFLNSMHIDKK